MTQILYNTDFYAWLQYYESDERSARGWKAKVNEQWLRIKLLWTNSPSLKTQLPDLLSGVYFDARELAVDALAVPVTDLPARSPWSLAQILDTSGWRPSGAAQ